MGIKVQDLAFVRFSAPDLDTMESFLTDFGMARASAAQKRSTCAALIRINFCT